MTAPDIPLKNLRKLSERVRPPLSELQIVIDEVRARVAEYGLTPEQVFGPKRRARKTNGASPDANVTTAKYRDPKSGATWSGRGRAPSWIKDKKRDRFLIA